MKNRLDFYNSYEEEHRIFKNKVQRFWALFGLFVSLNLLMTFDDVWLFLITLAMISGKLWFFLEGLFIICLVKVLKGVMK